MKAVTELVQGLAGPRSKPVLEGPEATLVAEDTLTGEIIGCAQLGRVEVAKRIKKEYQFIAPTTEEAARPGRRAGIYLDNDLEIKNVVVAADYRSIGVANNLVHGLLARLPPSRRAWAFAPSRAPPAFNFFFSAGFVGVSYAECAQVFPSFLWPQLRAFHGHRSAFPDAVFFAAEGRGPAE